MSGQRQLKLLVRKSNPRHGEDIERLRAALSQNGYVATDHDIEEAWSSYSDYNSRSGWESPKVYVVPEIVRILLKRLVES